MGTYTRGQLPHLTEDIIARGWAYQAFQALYMLETSLDLRDQDEDALDCFVAVAPAAELSFPAGEVRRCTIDASGRFRFELNLLGFYGVDSPLPQYFNDITSRDGNRELRAFLEIFNRRLYSLCYQAWKKFNLYEDNNNRASIYTRYLYAFSGGAEQQGGHDYAGVLGSRIKSAQGLAATLNDFLGYSTSIRENVPSWIALEQPARLGTQLQLGDNTMIGERLMDVSGKIAIFIGPLPMSVATDLLPGRPLSSRLAELIREYLDPSIDYNLELIVAPDRHDRSSLGSDGSILGWTCCLGQPGEATNRIRLTTSGTEPQEQTNQQPKTVLAAAA